MREARSVLKGPQEGFRRDLAEIVADTLLLKRASASILAMGLWDIVIFIFLSAEGFRVLSTLTSIGYPRTYPAMFLYYALSYVFLVMIMTPISVSFAYYSWKLGDRLKAKSLGFAGLCWLALAGVSIALIPSVYQDAMAMISGYQDAIARGILPNYFFNPLALPTIHQWIPVYLFVAELVLSVGAAEMAIRSHRNGFVSSAAIALISVILTTIGSALTLALFIYPFAVIVFGLEQRIMAGHEIKEI
jgi:hypothetical protein